MLSYQALLDKATQQLYTVSDSPRIDAEVLMQHATQCDLAWLIARNNDIASKEHSEVFSHYVEQRQLGKPIAYITGHKSFWSLELNVTPSVLIPRPDTETLVEEALARLQLPSANQRCQVLDLGTGSGAIALAIAKECPFAQVIAVDSQTDALDVAKKNADKNQLSNIHFQLGNWFEGLSSQFDLIVSNPPYIDADDPHLLEGDVRFEPKTALVSQQQGLEDLKHIVQSAPNFLKPSGWLIVEHGNQQHKLVSDAFLTQGFTHVQTIYDLNKQPRVTLGQIKP